MKEIMGIPEPDYLVFTESRTLKVSVAKGKDIAGIQDYLVLTES